MSGEALAFGAALAAVALAGPLLPLLRDAILPVEPLADPLEDERVAALRELREVDQERAAGRLDAASYEAVRARGERRAVDVLRRLRSRDGAQELAAAMRARSGARPARRGPGLPLVAAAAVLVLAAALPLALGMAPRAQGQLLTGEPAARAPSAREALEARLRQHPDDVAARLDVAKLALDSGDARRATAEYLEVLKRDPRNLEARTRLAYLVYLSGSARDALAALDRALELDPRYPEALFLRGVVLLRGLDRPADGADSLRAYLRVAPSGPYGADAQALLREAGGGD